MNAIDISVIIPTYKPAAYIWECLDSIKNQTFDRRRFEIIIILNGCDAPFREQIQQYIHQKLADYNICFLQTDTAGVSNARNLGLDMAQGEYIGFIDDDDYVSPSYLEELYQVASDGSTPISYTLAKYDSTGEIKPFYVTRLFDRNYGKGSRKITSVRSFFSGPCVKLVRRSAIGKRRFDVNLANGEDGLFMFEISDAIDRISLTSKNAIYYRRYRENSAISRKLTMSLHLYLILQYCTVYSHNIKAYNFVFFLSRIIASLRNIVA
ncbi:MAG: glycosyltransferase family 2 protein [Muribaculaceae bacterium]